MFKNKLDCFGSTLLKNHRARKINNLKKAYVSEWYISIDHHYQELLNIQRMFNKSYGYYSRYKFGISRYKITICSNNTTDSQPNTLKQTWKTANEHCRSRNASLASLNNSNNSGPLLTDLLIRRIRSSVDGRYTSWIAYKGN